MTIHALSGLLWAEHDKTKGIIRRVMKPSAAKDDRSGSSGAARTASNGSGPQGGKGARSSSYSVPQLVCVTLGPLACVLISLFFRPEGLGTEAAVVLGTTAWMALWWISECVPLPITSLLPIMIFPISGAMSSGEVFSAYGDNIVFLFLGGFLLAGALEKWDLHRRIAIGLIRLIGTSVQRLILGFILSTGIVSLWISNTATAMMMIPMGMAIVAQIRSVNAFGEKSGEADKFERSLIYGIGYAATIAGVGTLVGGTAAPIFASQANAILGVSISFGQFMLFGIPFVLVFLFALWLYLTKVKFRMRHKEIPGGKEMIDEQYRSLGRMSREEKTVAIVGSLVALMWVSSTWVIKPIVSDISDGMIAAMGALLLFALPARTPATEDKPAQSTRILVWEDTEKTPWGILLLFGGGLALAVGFTETGLSDWTGSLFSGLSGLPFVVALLVIVTAMVFLTEFTSTTATAMLFVPLMGAVGSSLGYDPLLVMLATAFAVNCAFMLPAATPPNAIIFGQGLVTIRDMVKTGFMVSLIGIVLVVVFVPLWGPVVFH